MQNPKDLILENFNSINKVTSYSLIRADNINSVNFLINTPKGKFVLRTGKNGFERNKIEKMCKIMDFCNKKNAKVYQPIKTTKGTYTIPKKNAFLTKYYPGSPFSGNEKEIVSVARSLAKLHRALDQVKINYNFQPNQLYYRLVTKTEIGRIKTKLKKQATPIDKKIESKIPYILKKVLQLSSKPTKKNLKYQLIHHDLHPGNVIFKNNGVSAIIDFNSMRKGYRIEDVAFAGFRFAEIHSKHKTIKEKLNLFCDAYERENKLTSEELDNLPNCLEKKIMSRISYILKKRYFRNDDMWTKDFDKNIRYLKTIEEIFC